MTFPPLNNTLVKRWLPFLVAVLVFVGSDLAITFSPLSGILDDAIDNVLDKKWADVQGDHPQTMDVVFLGTSRTNHGFVTQEFETLWESRFHDSVNAYNWGLPSANHVVFLYLLKSVMAELGTPKVVMVEVAPFMLKPGLMSDYSLLYINALIRHAPAIDAQVHHDPMITWDNQLELNLDKVSSLYRYRSVLGVKAMLRIVKRVMSGRYAPPEFEEGWVPYQKGTMYDNDTRFYEKGQDVALKHLSDFSAMDTVPLAQFLRFCQDNGMHVVMVQWPTHPAYEQFFNATDYPFMAQYTQTVEQLAAQYDASFVDLQTQAGWDERHWYGDPGHLDAEGAAHFTRLLVKVLPASLAQWGHPDNRQALTQGLTTGHGQTP